MKTSGMLLGSRSAYEVRVWGASRRELVLTHPILILYKIKDRVSGSAASRRFPSKLTGTSALSTQLHGIGRRIVHEVSQCVPRVVL